MEQTFKCTGNCLNCLPGQRAYCASQHSYSNMKVLDKMMENIIVIEERLNAINEKMEAMQSEELFNPNAQEGDGAEIIEAPKEITP